MCALPKEVFLSFSSLDVGFAGELVAILRRHGIPVWYSSTDLIGAQQWHDKIGEALRRCDWFLIVLSPNSLQSHWVKRELYFALKRIAVCLPDRPATPAAVRLPVVLVDTARHAVN